LEKAKAKLQKIAAKDERQPSALITEDAIAQRAYALYLGRGGEHGHDVEDWLQAERELQEIKNAPSSYEAFAELDDGSDTAVPGSRSFSTPS